LRASRGRRRTAGAAGIDDRGCADTLAPVRAIQQREFGGPEVLELVEVDPPVPGPGQVLIEVAHAGVNFADTHQRRNEYLAAAELPLVPGSEVAGRRAEDGERVVALTGGKGGYAQYAVAPAAHTFTIPDGVEDGVALGLLLQGLTAWHLLRTSARLAPGETVVVHAAAGGTGSLAVQLARAFGAGRVIATASSDDKRALALELGADAAIDGAPAGLTERLLEAGDGAPVDVVLEPIGGEVFDASLEALAPFGRLVTYGVSGGKTNAPNTRKLMRASRAVVGFWFRHCLERPELLDEPLADLLARAARGELRVVVGATYPLEQAAQAQIDLAERRTTGKVLLSVS
jgi:NADPH2:quinone reductase